MNIGVDIRMINHSGIGTYIKNIVPLVINQMSADNFILFHDSPNPRTFFNQNNVEFVKIKSPIYSISEQIEFLKFNNMNIDLFWSPHYNIPVFLKTKLIVTVHDIFHLVDKDSSVLKRIYSRILFNIIKNNASKILTVSNFTKKQIIDYLNVDESSIKVVYNGVSSSFRSKKNINKEKYLLYVGNIKKHKNINFLINVFNNLNEKDLKLYIVGNYSKLKYPDKDVINAINNSDNIVLKDEVDAELLVEYYSNAELFIFPSLYEGFGLPPLEAMACGCPVLASNQASIPEVCSDGAEYFNPYDESDLLFKIKELLNDVNKREKMIKNGYNNIKQFSWIDKSHKIVDLFKKNI